MKKGNSNDGNHTKKRHFAITNTINAMTYSNTCGSDMMLKSKPSGITVASIVLKQAEKPAKTNQF